METPMPGQSFKPETPPSGPANPPQNPAPQQVQPPVAPPQAPPEQPAQPTVQPPVFQAEIPTEVPADAAMQPQEDAITWTASEYIAHHKSFGWYLLLALVAAVFAALVYFLTGGDKLSAAVVVLVAVVFGIYAAKQPKEQRYAISDAGITIGERTYDFSQFKSFAIAEDGPFPSITFMPLKRFMPAVSIYYDPQDEENIVNALSLFLPVEEHRTDMVDRLMKKIRF